MAKRFSPEFKQQAIDYALTNSSESIAALAKLFDLLYLSGFQSVQSSNSFLKLGSSMNVTPSAELTALKKMPRISVILMMEWTGS
ncbi:transposase-like protein [Acinetobacter calcoaceticus]|uniref:Transposase-like protein n=1 Tax=Acinetobacter calcoaceticus TaxID=471 RepID=A0A4R1XUJ7_ACICA|nr:transposase-like protein [Acinetobacter calcoaceticus]